MPFPRRTPSLPLEIYDEITDHLRGDKATLKSCSLTCKALLKRSRYNLFFELVVRPRDFPSVVDFLESSCHIATSIRLLSLKHMDIVPTGIATEDGVVMLHLPLLMSLLPSVHTVRFSQFHFPRLSTKHRSEFFINFQDIKNVELDEVTTYTLDELLDIIGAFPSLESVNLSRCVQSSHHNLNFSKFTITSRLRVHIFEQRFETGLVKWLLKQDKNLLLKSLHYNIPDITAKCALQELLGKTGQSLEYFHIAMSYGRPYLSLYLLLLNVCRRSRSLCRRSQQL
jgi:hypothetical protein